MADGNDWVLGSTVPDTPTSHRGRSSYRTLNWALDEGTALIGSDHGNSLTLNQVKKRLVKLGLRRRGPGTQPPMGT